MFTVTLNHYLFISAALLVIGVCGIFINRKNIITILLSIELMLLAVNLNLIGFSAFNHNLHGQLFSIFVLTVAAAESAIGLAILVIHYRNCGSIEVEDINQMKG
jgi:NADH-quinone oxidoreductase subunit K